MNRLGATLTAMLALAGGAWAQEDPQLLAAAQIGIAGHGFALEGAGMVLQGAAEAAPAGYEAPEDRNEVQYIGGRHTQAGDPDAGDEPVKKLPKPQSKDVFRPAFSIAAPPRAEASSPIVAKAREFMRNPPYNPNNGTHDWAGWCLGFVNTTMKAVRGKGDPAMAQPAAKNAYYAMERAGRISKDFRSVPAGAALLWANCSQWGHAAIATGEMSADGTPIMVTTAAKGIREMSVKQFGCGMPTGWGKI